MSCGWFHPSSWLTAVPSIRLGLSINWNSKSNDLTDQTQRQKDVIATSLKITDPNEALAPNQHWILGGTFRTIIPLLSPLIIESHHSTAVLNSRSLSSGLLCGLRVQLFAAREALKRPAVRSVPTAQQQVAPAAAQRLMLVYSLFESSLFNSLREWMSECLSDSVSREQRRSCEKCASLRAAFTSPDLSDIYIYSVWGG